MTSIYTNTSTLSALRSLRQTTNALTQSNTALSTGLSVRTAADNPAVWALGQNVSQATSDYVAIGQSLSAAKASVAVGRVGAEQIAGALSEMRAKVIQASGAGANVGALQTEIDALKEQIAGAARSAGIGGVNLLQGELPGGGATYAVLNGVQGGKASFIDVAVQDLRSDAPRFGTNVVATADVADYVSAAAETVDAGEVQAFDIEAGGVAEGVSYRITLAGDGAHALGGGASFEYVARAGDASADVARALGDQINKHIADNGLETDVNVVVDPANGRLSIANTDADAADTISLTATVATGGSAGGGLAGLEAVDVTTAAGRREALGALDRLISSATDAAAALGGAEKSIDRSNRVVDELADINAQALSAMVDTDMPAEVARLKAKQAQQEIALQTLSMMLDSESRIVSLFKS